MRGKHFSKDPLILLVLLLLLGAGPMLADGTQTGTLIVTVVDGEGQGVADATVKLEGERLDKTVVTDSAGKYRFPALAIGDYSVRAELGAAGLSAAGRARISIAKTNRLELTLTSSTARSVSEEVDVVAQTPLVDRYDTSLGATVDFEFLDRLPVERFYQSVALLLPGVAGGEDGNPNVGGSLNSHNIYLVDGVDTTDPTTGLFGLNLSHEAVQEVEVATGGYSAEYGRVSGAVINVVTRSGGNDFSGLARWVATNPEWNGDYETPSNAGDALVKEINAANATEDQLFGNAALSIGGPIFPGNLWFSAAYEENETSLFRPVFEGPEPYWDQGIEGDSGAYKLTWQIGESNTVVGQLTTDEAELGDFSPFDDNPSANVVDRPDQQSDESRADGLLFPGDPHAAGSRYQDGTFSKLQWSSILSSNLSLQVTAAHQDRDLERLNDRARGVSGGAPHYDLIRNHLFNGITQEGREERRREQGNLLVDWFLETEARSHQLKLGVDYQSTESFRDLRFPGVQGIDPTTGQPTQGQLFLDIIANATPSGGFQTLPYLMWNFWERPARTTTEEVVGLFIDEQLTLGQWHFHFGLRFEDIQAQDDGGSALLDARTIAPRLGFTYDLGGQGTTLARGSFGRFYEPFLQNYTDNFDRSSLFSGYTDYIWAPFLGESSVDGVLCSSQDPTDSTSPCWIDGLERPLGQFQFAPPNTELDPSYVDEIVLGLEHQLSSQSSISFHLVHREWGDLWDDVYTADLILNPDGTVARDPNNGAFLANGFENTIANIEAAEREYRAAQLMIKRRFSDGWQFLGSYTWSDTEGNLFTNEAIDDFADFSDLTGVQDPGFQAFLQADLANRLGPASWEREHQLKLFGSYRFSTDRMHFTVGSSARFESGTPYPMITDGNFTIRRFATARDAHQLPDVFQLDLSLALAFLYGQNRDRDVEIKAEIFNLTDEQEQIGAETFEGAGFGLPRSLFDLQSPRNFRLTLGLRF